MIRSTLLMIIVASLAGCMDQHRRATDGAASASAAANQAATLSDAAHADVKVARERFEVIGHEAGKAEGDAQRVIIEIEGERYEVARQTAERLRGRLGIVQAAASEGHDATERALTATATAGREARRAVEGVRTVEQALPDLVSRRGFLGQAWDFIRGMGILALIIAAVVALAYIGVGNITRPLFAAIGLIPRAIKEQAERAIHDIQAAKNGGPELTSDRVREIENRRATDPMYYAAFARLARNHKV